MDAVTPREERLRGRSLPRGRTVGQGDVVGTGGGPPGGGGTSVRGETATIADVVRLLLMGDIRRRDKEVRMVCGFSKDNVPSEDAMGRFVPCGMGRSW